MKHAYTPISDEFDANCRKCSEVTTGRPDNWKGKIMTWQQQRHGPGDVRYVIGPEPENRFIAQMDNEATDAEWQLAAAAPDLLEACEAAEVMIGAPCVARDLLRAAIAKAKSL